MEFIRRLFSGISGPPRAVERQVYPLRVQCDRCGEIIEGTVDLRNDLSADYAEGSGAPTFICRKVVMGRARCFQQVEVTLRFDAARRLLEQQASGGKFLPPEADPRR